MDSFAVLECVDIREIHIVPLVAAFRSNPCVNKHNDAVAGLNETLGIAPALGPSASGLCQVLFYACATMVSAAAREFRRFGPLNLRIEGCQGGVNIAAIECSVCGAKRSDHRVELRVAIHLRVQILRRGVFHIP